MRTILFALLGPFASVSIGAHSAEADYLASVEAELIAAAQSVQESGGLSEWSRLHALAELYGLLDAQSNRDARLINLTSWSASIEQRVVSRESSNGDIVEQIHYIAFNEFLSGRLSASSPESLSLNSKQTLFGFWLRGSFFLVDVLAPASEALVEQSVASRQIASRPLTTEQKPTSLPSLLPIAESQFTAENQASSALLPDCSTKGEQKSLVVAVNYQDDLTQSPSTSAISDLYFGASNSLADYWNEVSYEQTSLSGVNLGWHTLDNTVSSTNACGMTTEIRQQALDFAATQVDISEYNRLFIVMRELGAGCSYVGEATTSCSILSTSDGHSSANVSTHWVLGNILETTPQRALDLIVHEAGHNLGLGHAGRLFWGASQLTGPILDNSTATFFETGDFYDAMGGSDDPTHYNLPHKRELDWITSTQVLEANGAQSLKIEPLTSTDDIEYKAMRLYRGADNAGRKEYFWISTRADAGYDSFANSLAYGTLHVHQDQQTFLDSLSYQVDANPATGTPWDAPIGVGASIYDAFSGITISHLGLDAQGNPTIGVTVDAGFEDSDEDGLRLSMEQLIGTDPGLSDTDADGLTDKAEVCFDGDCSSYNPFPVGGDLNPISFDTDSDGMHDNWELLNGFNPLLASDASGDADGDGTTNLQEFLDGTDPQGADSDGDGLSDGIEVLIGTLVNNPDSDSDNMTDGWEYSNMLDPLNPADAAGDADNDGLINSLEFTLATNPNSDDSDGDTLRDQDEVNFYGTNPAERDTDSDYLTDAEELNLGTDPTLASLDTDGDGMGDDWEAAKGTNPAFADAGEDLDGDGYDNILEFFGYADPNNITEVPALKTWHVDAANTTGIEDGSIEHPFSRINYAYDASADGDIIQLAGGVYSSETEQLITINKAIHIKGLPDRSAQIVGLGMAVGIGTPWAKVENLTLSYSSTVGILGANSTIVGCNIQAAKGVIAQSAIGAKFINNIVNELTHSFLLNLLNVNDFYIANNVLIGSNVAIQHVNEVGTIIENNIFMTPIDLSGFAVSNNIRFNLLDQAGFVNAFQNYWSMPVFENAAAGDYRLASGSSGIAMGNPDSDFTLEPQPNGYRINIGAFGGTELAATITDADGDHLADSWENAFGLSTNLDSLYADSDSDGFSNYQEYFYGSAPNDILDFPTLANIDQDNDGIDDTIDNCPLNSNPSQIDDDVNGIGNYCEPDFIVIISPWSSVILLFAFYSIYRRSVPK